MEHYEKDFEAWLRLKALLQRKPKASTFHEREIWWLAIGQNLGDEEDGKGAHFARPVIILRKFNHRLFWGIPTTSQPRRGKYYLNFRYNLEQTDNALLSQLRVFDSKRLLSKHGIINETDFANLQLQLILLVRNYS